MGIGAKMLLAVSMIGNLCCTDHHITHKLPAEKESICEEGYKINKLELKGDEAHVVIYDPSDTKEWNGKSDFNCILHIKSPKNMGIVAVIQKMSLRRDPKEPNCWDYIQFRPYEEQLFEKLLNFKLHKRPNWGLPICGEVDAFKETPPTIENPLYANTAFVDHNGYIEVKIHLARRRLEPNENVAFQIVFTALQSCKNATGKLLECTPSVCLDKNFFNDKKYINCPNSKCTDEKCTPFHAEGETSEKMVNGIIVTAGVLSVMISFIIFLGCYITCRSMEICWVIRESSRSRDRGTELSQVEPSAPPVESSPNKDLPPSYETLFPER